MMNLALPLSVLGLFLLQTPEQGRQPREQGPPVETSPSAPQAPTVPGEKAFGRLFEQKQQPDPRHSLPNQKPATKIVCGMVVIQADPNIDPKFVIRAPDDSSTMKIRRIPPATCAE
jgi:hypothetical protein